MSSQEDNKDIILKQELLDMHVRRQHSLSNDEFWRYLHLIPPPCILEFGTEATISDPYREALYKFAPFYCVEEIVGTYLGHNEQFPSEEDWMNGVRPEHSSPR